MDDGLRKWGWLCYKDCGTTPPNIVKNLVRITLVLLAALSVAQAQQTSKNNQRLKDGLAQYPEADADKDGILTMEEARAFLQKRRKQGGGGAKEQKTTIFEPTAEELQAVEESFKGTDTNGA